MSIKLILIGLAVAAIGGILAHNHYLSRKYQATKAELVQANATITAERAAREHELKIAKDASDAYQKDLADLRAARSNDPLPSVVCKRSRSVPATASTATGSDAAGTGNDAGANEEDRDIGPLLDDFATACEANLSQLTRLQEWVRSR
jgi:hypothetical protein